MASLSPVDAVLSVGQRIGRYFTLVSLIPALFLVLWVYMLVASRSLSGTPELSNVEYALSHWSVGKAAGLVLASLAVAFVLNPLQFATTQLLEGYWGATPLATAAMKIRIVHHRKRQRYLQEKAATSKSAWRDECLRILREDPKWRDDPETRDDYIESVMGTDRGDPLMLYVIAEQEARDQCKRNYPSDVTRMLPTQLGNALRRFEDAAGEQYELSALAIAPHLQLVAPPRHLEYLVDARQDMDSAIGICTVGLVATVLTASFLLTSGLWLLWAIVPYTISYLGYKGAVSAAQGYGTVIESVIDLDRFLLYNELGLDFPQDSKEERETNIELMQILAGKQGTLRYRRENLVSESSATSSSTDDSRNRTS